jgi:uncharacterized protein (TIGR00369 family)
MPARQRFLQTVKLMSNDIEAAFEWADHQKALLDRSLHSGFNVWAGIGLIEVKRGYARLSFRPRTEMLTPWGTLNGGVLNSLVEVPPFVALLTELQAGELPVTNDIFIQHLRPLPGDAEYELTGSLLRRGKTMAWAETSVAVGGNVVTLARITKTLVRA